MALEWSFGDLAGLSNINKGSLQRVEKGESHLPDNKRQRLIDVLAEGLEKIGRPVNRREFLELAGLTAASTTVGTTSSITQLIGSPEASGEEKLIQAVSHEERARILNERHEWQQAATFWLLAAQEAKHREDWATWSRCLVSAGLMALNLSQFEIAESRFKEVIEKSQDEVGALTLAEAYLRLGWLYYEQDKFSRARQALLNGQALLQSYGSKERRLLYLASYGKMLIYGEGKEQIIALEAVRLHWLGRIYVDWGIQQDNQALIKKGLLKLQEAGKYDSELGFYPNVGFAFLRQIPALHYQGEFKLIENHLSRSEELLGMQGTAAGHIALHKGLVTLEEQPKKAQDFLEMAHERYIEPVFYPKGLSDTLKEISVMHAMEGKKSEDETAFNYALVAAILHPYGRNLETLQVAAHKMYWRLGESKQAFNTFWRAIEEKLWSMDIEPFSDLRYLVMSFQEHGIQLIETALEKVKKAIRDELSMNLHK